MGDWAVFASADVEQVAGVQNFLPLLEAGGELDAADGDVFVAGCVVVAGLWSAAARRRFVSGSA